MEWSVPKLISLNGATGYGRDCTSGGMAKTACTTGGINDGGVNCSVGNKDVGFVVCQSGSAASSECDAGGAVG
jgi:hypothetical protein